jgi:hypothetical protein
LPDAVKKEQGAKRVLLNWKWINEHEFTALCGDLLRSAGFSQVQVQGSESGGEAIDILATELVPFTFGGRRPLRWAIQCKFSVHAEKSSLRSEEFGDMDTVFRSERLSGHNLRGYMLVTNRRVTQNVIGLLQDTACRFGHRTMIIGANDLSNLLGAHSSIADLYFGEQRHRFAHLGPPAEAMTTTGAAHGPNIMVQVEAPFDPRRRVSTEAVVNMGSSLSMLPESVLAPLGVTASQKMLFETAFGQFRLNVYEVVLKIAGRRFEGVQAIGGVHEYGLIGMNVLTNFLVLYDGPNRGLRLWHGGEFGLPSKPHASA